ncbi:MAG: iron-containing alcohol dehydrogenase, partial [Spirochaetae bacterium HGW-Spirochaetae-6]
NINVRKTICEAGILASLALKFGSQGLAYAIAMVIKSVYGINQALAMSVILPYVMEFNLTTSANKLVFISKAFGDNISDISVVEAAIKAIENVRKISIENNIPQRLNELNIAEEDLLKIAKIARNYEFLHNLPRPVSREDILTILSSAY